MLISASQLKPGDFIVGWGRVETVRVNSAKTGIDVGLEKVTLGYHFDTQVRIDLHQEIKPEITTVELSS
jgi:hypothetical protein